MVNNDRKDRKWKKTKAVIKGVVGIVALVTALSSLYTVDQTEQAVVTRFGRPVKVILNPLERKDKEERTREIREADIKEEISYDEGAGLYFKLPFIERATKFDRRLLRWNGYPEQIPTRDKKYVWVDTTARAYIEDPLQFLRRGATEQQFHGRLDEIIDSVTRTSITQRDLIEVVRTDNREMRIAEKELAETTKEVLTEVKEGRSEIVNEITEKSKDACREYGIGIFDEGILIKGLVYVESVKETVENRMMAERERIAKKYLSQGEGEFQNIMGRKERDIMRICSEAYKKAREIEGEADAKAVEIYADAYGRDPEFYQFIRSLQLYEEALATGKTRLVIGLENPLMRNLRGENYSNQPAEIKK